MFLLVRLKHLRLVMNRQSFDLDFKGPPSGGLALGNESAKLLNWLTKNRQSGDQRWRWINSKNSSGQTIRSLFSTKKKRRSYCLQEGPFGILNYSVLNIDRFYHTFSPGNFFNQVLEALLSL
ncbi:hypothetical protein CEXT_741531 [Caerostris extrusa]|uniref:Uncharacterized protein n=1 Tax=Caerostris extrusa TaxID=172846 RepID=A0AAV4N6P6_CAEEX|nr:hypothetical protein CEXT_741531 [Caerostris extrusa]